MNYMEGLELQRAYKNRYNGSRRNLLVASIMDLQVMYVNARGKRYKVRVQYNGGLLPDIVLLTQWYHHRGTRLNAHEEVLYLQPLIPPKRFDIFSPLTGACSEGLGAF